MPPKPTVVDFGKLIQDGGATVKYEVSSPEHPEDKDLRLLKERWNFFIKEIGPYVLAAVFVLAIGGYCLVVLSHSASSADDKLWARSTLSVIAAGVVGVIFGKVTK